MRILVIGAGGVGSAVAAIARRRAFFERMVLADLSSERSRATVARLGDERFASAQLDASDEDAIVALAQAERADAILNACDPWLNPPLIWERERGWYTTAPFSEPERFDFPAGIGPVECVNVEHEEVVLVPRWVDCERVTFKYGLGDEFLGVLKTLSLLGLDSTETLRVKGVDVAPRDVVAAALPDPATLGDRMSGRTCAGTLVTGTGKDGRPRAVYLHHVVDNEEAMARDGVQAVVWQTAINPVVAMELLATGAWHGAGVLGPEAFDAVPFLDLLADYGAPHGMDERDPANPSRISG